MSLRKNNDELWEAMRPALLLVSKVLEEKPEFLNAIVRIWDFKTIPPSRDTRPNKQFPLSTFDIVPPPANHPDLWPEAQFLRPMGDKYVDAIWEILTRDMRLHVLNNTDSCGITHHDFNVVVDKTMLPNCFIVVNAKLIYPLLVPGYSSSEKVMTSYYLAATILHEIAVSLVVRALPSLTFPPPPTCV